MHNQGFLFPENPLWAIISMALLVTALVSFFFLFNISIQPNVETITEQRIEQQHEQTLLNYLRTPVALDGDTVKPLSDLVMAAQGDEHYTSLLRTNLGLVSQMIFSRTGWNFGLQITYPDGQIVNPFGNIQTFARSYLPSTQQGDITLNFGFVEIDFKKRLETLQPGDKFFAYGKLWVAWGMGNSVQYISQDGCTCVMKLQGSETVCDDGMKPNYLLGKFSPVKSFGPNVVEALSCPKGKVSAQTFVQKAVKDFNAAAFKQSVQNIAQAQETGKEVTDSLGNTWVYWGEYVLFTPSTGYGNIQQQDVVSLWMAPKLCNCLFEAHCPATCATATFTGNIPGVLTSKELRHLYCQEDDSKAIPESVMNNHDTCFKTTGWLQDNG